MVLEKDPAESAPRPHGLISAGQRLAGAVLIANAAVVVAEMVLLPDLPAVSDLPGPSRIAPLVLDVLIGGYLLAGSPKLVVWAIVRVVLGLLLYTGLALAASDMIQASLQIGFSVAVLLLLVGTAGRARIVAGCALVGLYLLLSVVSIYALTSGHNPMAGAVLALKGELERPVVGELQGEASAYRLRVPDTGWSLRTREVARRDNPLADLWMVRPDRDAHVLVIDEQLANMATPVDRLTDAVIGNGKAAASEYRQISREPLPGRPEDGRLLRVDFTVAGQRLSAFIAVVTSFEHNYQVLAMCPRTNVEVMAAELQAILESFEPAPARPPANVVGPAGRVVGQFAPYVLTGASGWYLREDAAARADNPLADRWLVRPERDAHLFVIAEENPEPIELAAFAAIVQGNLRKNDKPMTIGEPQPDGRGGLQFHVSLDDPIGPLEFDYGLHVVGRRLFQVIAFGHKDYYPALKDELLGMLASFTPPPAEG